MRLRCLLRFVSLAYKTYGDPSLPLKLIFIHGFLGEGDNFKSIANHSTLTSLAQTFTLDQRNHGHSPHTDQHSIPCMAADISQWLYKMKINNAILVGHSLGGKALRALAERHPDLQSIVRTLVIMDINNTVRGDVLTSEAYHVVKSLADADLSKPRKELMAEMSNKFAPAIAGLISKNLVEKNGVRHWKVNAKVLLKDFPQFMQYESKMTAWKKPVKLIFGRRSIYFNPKIVEEERQVFQNIKQEDLMTIDSGHWIHAEKPAQFIDIMSNIIK